VVLESAILNVIPGEEAAFEEAMKTARPLIAATPGFVAIDVHRCMETANQYLLLVQWRSLEDHTVGFRQSDRFPRWRELLHHFYDPAPLVQHYGESFLLKDPD
jgi:heme-degrading monooxygenase HmoA